MEVCRNGTPPLFLCSVERLMLQPYLWQRETPRVLPANFSAELHQLLCRTSTTSLQKSGKFSAEVFSTDHCRVADYRSDFRILLFALSMAMVSSEAR